MQILAKLLSNLRSSRFFQQIQQSCSSWFVPRDPQHSSTDDQASVGKRGENLAAKFLKNLGYRVLFRSYETSRGEVDLIALDDRVVVFVEVKAWSRAAGQGGPSDAVDEEKQKRLTNAALEFLKDRGLLNSQARFDVIQVIMEGKDGEPELRHFKNAFEAVGRFQMFS